MRVEIDERRERVELIKEIEITRSSRVIVYFTGDRAPFSTKIANDAIKIFHKHLSLLGKQEKISLFLYSRGGDIITPLRLCRLIREYAQEFEVIIPYRAHSAATLLCLGADKIVMGPLAELSPIDPSTEHPFNPIDPNDPNQRKRIPISVEDLTSYFLLAKEKAGVRDEQMVSIFNELVDKIHPLALGNVYRGYRMIRVLAKKLLLLHMDRDRESSKIENIVKKLTEELCIHGYLISRDEAIKDIGLNVEIPDKKLEELIWMLYTKYESKMELDHPFDAAGILGDENEKTINYFGAYIESALVTDVFKFEADIKKVEVPPGVPQINLSIKSYGWFQLYKEGE